jgi:hypothetical protein
LTGRFQYGRTLFDGNLNGINGQADFFHTCDVLSDNCFIEIASA